MLFVILLVVALVVLAIGPTIYSIFAGPVFDP
jgi:hypothetical protein